MTIVSFTGGATLSTLSDTTSYFPYQPHKNKFSLLLEQREIPLKTQSRNLKLFPFEYHQQQLANIYFRTMLIIKLFRIRINFICDIPPFFFH